MLVALKSVDAVVLFDEDTSVRLMRELKPATYVKGGDYRVENLPEAEVAAEIGAGQRLPIVQQGFDRAGMYDAAAVLTSTWADVNRPVRRLDCFLVMFHNDQGVAQIPETNQSLDQSPVDPLVQPDAGLIEHIEDTDQS